LAELRAALPQLSPPVPQCGSNFGFLRFITTRQCVL
jgi:hypothetical protein